MPASLNPQVRWSHCHTQIRTLTKKEGIQRFRRTRLSSMHRSRAHHSSGIANPGAPAPTCCPGLPISEMDECPFLPLCPPLALSAIPFLPYPEGFTGLAIHCKCLFLSCTSTYFCGPRLPSDPAPSDRTPLYAALRCLPGLVYPQPLYCRLVPSGLPRTLIHKLNWTGAIHMPRIDSCPSFSSEEAQSPWAAPPKSIR